MVKELVQVAEHVSPEVDELWEQFHEVVTMTSRELDDWLGVQPDVSGPHPGEKRRAPLGDAVLDVLRKRRTDLTDDDVETMRRVVDLVAEETEGLTRDEVLSDERRRHRLMTVGHDPFRDDR